MQNEIEKIIGRTPTAIKQDADTITFEFKDGCVAKFYHEQNCCEVVDIEDVNGDWADLIGAPLLVAEERVSRGENENWGSETWTFYTFRSIKGSVDVRWHGQSNGYYSESVSLSIFEKAHP